MATVVVLTNEQGEEIYRAKGNVADAKRTVRKAKNAFQAMGRYNELLTKRAKLQAEMDALMSDIKARVSVLNVADDGRLSVKI